MPKKVVPIKYTDRDFDSIKSSLIEHIRRYYPNTFEDFSAGSFGSIMLDTVSYIGDILSFYLDYQANESFLDTANEYQNIVKIGKQFGFKPEFNTSSYGTVAMYILVPSNSTGTAPDMDYAPIVKRKTVLTSTNGNNFMLDEDVDFSAPNVQIRVAQVDDDTGVPITYAVKNYGRVVSGNLAEEVIEIGPYEKYLKVNLENFTVAEVLEVLDSEGNEYYEVDYLSQDVVYKDVTNRGDTKHETPSILKPFVVPRRFTVERDLFTTSLQFGASSDIEVDVDNNVRKNYIDPAEIILRRQGAPYIKDSAFDPYKLIISDEFGIAPSNTNLVVTLRVNNNDTVNAPVGSVTEVLEPIVEFRDAALLNPIDAERVQATLQVNNETPITGDANLDSADEMRIKIFDFFAAQNRAVTATDYQAIAYAMPGKFGSIKRIRVMRDPDSLKRNLNMYVISADNSTSNNLFLPTNMATKQNLKTWLMKNKMVNDTIDILDAKIINIAIDYEAVGRLGESKFEILQESNDRLISHFSRKADIGEPFFITDVYQVLKDVDAIVDVTKVTVTAKKGGDYADVRFSVLENTSPDGRYINIPMNCVYEIKFPQDDIRGFIK
jgi:hypothetical protein